MHGVISKKIDPDLAALLNDGTFQRTLRGATFYRQHLDESFQPNKLHRHFARPKSASGTGTKTIPGDPLPQRSRRRVTIPTRRQITLSRCLRGPPPILRLQPPKRRTQEREPQIKKANKNREATPGRCAGVEAGVKVPSQQGPGDLVSRSPAQLGVGSPLLHRSILAHTLEKAAVERIWLMHRGLKGS